MTSTQRKTAGENKNVIPSGDGEPRSSRIDRTAPAGSENSLGAESVRDGRPATDDSTVEAIDEESPAMANGNDR
jgi:hypothetical protein